MSPPSPARSKAQRPEAQRPKAQHSKAQIALWMLTKMAMIFFIIALALVLTGMAGKEKAGLCEARAEGVVQNIRSQVVGVVSAPIEDERKVIPFERVLATGSEDFQRYNLTVTWRKTGSGGEAKQTLVFEAKTLSEKCSSGSSMAVQDVVVHFPSTATQNAAGARATQAVTIAEPSKKYGSLPDGSFSTPSLYLIVLKCARKEWPPKKHLFIEDCSNPKPENCMNFNTTEVNNCCGWAKRDEQGNKELLGECPDGLGE